MKKCSISLLCVLILCFSLVISATASSPRLVDDADLLSAAEEASLTVQLDAVSEKHRVDVVIVTTNSTNGKSPMAYADDFFDENGYGYGENYDGVLLLISIEDRDWWISTSGLAIRAIDDATIGYIGDSMVDDLSVGLYASAMDTFVQQCDYYIDGEINGFPFPFMQNLLISLVIGFVAALIVTGVMRSRLKSVHRQAAAADYIKPDSMKVTQANDFFIYRQVNRVKKQSSSGSSTHTSSSGRTHGGGGGKF